MTGNSNKTIQRNTAFDIYSTTIFFQSDKYYTNQASCLEIYVRATAVTVTCFEKENMTTVQSATTSNTIESDSSTTTVVSKQMEKHTTANMTLTEAPKQDTHTKRQSDDGNVPTVAATIGSLVFVCIVLAVGILKYRRWKRQSQDIETENPLYRTDKGNTCIGSNKSTEHVEGEYSYAHVYYISSEKNDSSQRDIQLILLPKPTVTDKFSNMSIENESESAEPDYQSEKMDVSILANNNGLESQSGEVLSIISSASVHDGDQHCHEDHYDNPDNVGEVHVAPTTNGGKSYEREYSEFNEETYYSRIEDDSDDYGTDVSGIDSVCTKDISRKPKCFNDGIVIVTFDESQQMAKAMTLELQKVTDVYNHTDEPQSATPSMSMTDSDKSQRQIMCEIAHTIMHVITPILRI